MKKIGITTTVPSEVLIAAGYSVVDLNNTFITSENYEECIDIAEKAGFPKNLCGWIKGIYGACILNDIDEVVGVIGGDCSNTKGLIDVLEMKGIKVYPFAYPHERDIGKVKESIDQFMRIFNVTNKEVEHTRKRLNRIRLITTEIDELTYKKNIVNGFENHLLQVSLSDFDGNVDEFEDMLNKKLLDIKKRKPINKKLRLGYIGVPPMTGDIYSFVEEFNATFVYNEVQREFAFPRFQASQNIYEQYYNYTYPFDLNFRLDVIKKEIQEREIDAIIHYTQAFCHRAIEDIVFKEKIDIPILNIEGDKSTHLDARTKLRIEAFLDMLLDSKEMK
ncbi:2-hydroxyacyl-CoA dehydratase family protein [Sporosalibacterium faouarense]|uniref:2-hydroxyacyl-CoA dehydratase family protein n=1 Tax=Sporosalibacterium faouarense TaxID=516123 RepID=UPI00192B880E|nr:2-hydroxyacyl-CoA dehydratase [Sporosalibacterium faouarense]